MTKAEEVDDLIQRDSREPFGWAGCDRPTGAADRACAVGAAAAHDINNELTIIVNNAACLLEVLEPGSQLRSLLIELQQAAHRCTWKAQGLLNYASRRGVRPVCASMERLIVEQTEGMR